MLKKFFFRKSLAICFSLISLGVWSVSSAHEITIDLDMVKNPCEAIREGLKEYWNDAGSELRKSHLLIVRGSAHIDASDLIDVGDYKLCAGLGYGLFDDEQYLVDESRSSVKLNGLISFENVVLSYDEKNQKKPVVIFQLGSFYNFGWANDSHANGLGGISVGGAIEGRLSIYFTGKEASDWGRGDIPGLPFIKGNVSDTTTIGWFETGINRTDMTRLSLSIEHELKDPDNVGFIHQHSWGLRRGPIRIENAGVGMLFYGNSVGTISDSYIYRNDYGLVLGDFKIGGDVAPSPSCILGRQDQSNGSCEIRNSQVAELGVRDSVIEGNAYGNLVINDAERIDFGSVHLEMALQQYQKGHGVLIGGGHCSGDVIGACADDADCGSGKCEFPKRTLQRSIRFYGGLIGGDRYSNKWDGVVLGENAKQKTGDVPSVYFEALMQFSDLNPQPQIRDSCYLPGVSCGLISCKEGADLIIDFSRAFYDQRASEKVLCESE